MSALPPFHRSSTDVMRELGLTPVWKKRQTAPYAPKAAADSRPREAHSLQMDWAPLEKAVEQCTLCELCQKRKNPAFGTGDRQATVMFIGEGPGEQEDRQGEPFVGEAGKLLDKMLAAIQLSRKHNVYIANIVKCRPPGNRNPTIAECQACLPYLQRQIELVKPRLLVALGRVAAVTLLNTETSIGSLRQKMHDYLGIPFVVTYHPAYLLRSPLEKRKSWDDLRFVRRLLADG